MVDPSPEARALATSLAPGVPTFASIEAVLGDPSIEGAVVATPAETHADLCVALLEAGKDVLCEKPLALNYAAAKRAAEMADARGRVLMVGHLLEYHPAIRALVALVRRGELGELQYLYSNRLNLGKIRREENILWSFAPHDVAVALRITGTLPTEVSATGGAYVQPAVADVTVTHLRFPGGVRAHVFVSWLHPFKEQRLVVVGSRRMAVFDDVKHELVLFDQHVDFHEGEPLPVRAEGQLIPYDRTEPLRLECEAFLEAMRTREAPLTNAASGLRVLRVLDAAQKSLASRGEPVEVSG